MNLIFLVALYFGSHADHPAGTARLQGCTVSVVAFDADGWRADVSCKDQGASYVVLKTRRFDKEKQHSFDDLAISQVK